MAYPEGESVQFVENFVILYILANLYVAGIPMIEILYAELTSIL